MLNIDKLNRLKYLSTTGKSELHELLLDFEGCTITAGSELIHEYMKDWYRLTIEEIEYVLDSYNVTVEGAIW